METKAMNGGRSKFRRINMPWRASRHKLPMLEASKTPRDSVMTGTISVYNGYLSHIDGNTETVLIPNIWV